MAIVTGWTKTTAYTAFFYLVPCLCALCVIRPLTLALGRIAAPRLVSSTVYCGFFLIDAVSMSHQMPMVRQLVIRAGES